MKTNEIWTELTPNNTKSYHRKAYVYTVYSIETGEIIAAYLKSYETIVCSVELETHHIYKHWNNYSKTTMLHINDFLRSFDIPTLSKKQWDNISYTTEKKYF